MISFTVAIFAYAIVAGFAILMTLQEQRQTGGRPMAQMAGGFLACMVWPLTAVVVLVTVHRRPG
ncbi:MAG: hypothetical protein ACK4GO_03020 [Gemmobacter sp.]